MIERFTKVEGNMLKLYYTMSTWNPYTVVKMESDFTVTRREDNGGDDGTRIRRRQRRASCTWFVAFGHSSS